MNNYDELDDQIDFSKNNLIERIQYYLSICEDEMIKKYLVNSIEEINGILTLDKLTKKELEIEENMKKYKKIVIMMN